MMLFRGTEHRNIGQWLEVFGCGYRGKKEAGRRCLWHPLAFPWAHGAERGETWPLSGCSRPYLTV